MKRDPDACIIIIHLNLLTSLEMCPWKLSHPVNKRKKERKKESATTTRASSESDSVFLLSFLISFRPTGISWKSSLEMQTKVTCITHPLSLDYFQSKTVLTALCRRRLLFQVSVITVALSFVGRSRLVRTASLCLSYVTSTVLLLCSLQ